jgi:hypothetical protein
MGVLLLLLLLLLQGSPATPGGGGGGGGGEALVEVCIAVVCKVMQRLLDVHPCSNPITPSSQ